MAHLTNKESPLRLSKRKQAERGLSPTNAIAKQTSLEFQHLAAIVAGSDDAIISKTLDGIVTSWNASAARMFGHTAREMVGQPIACIVPVDLQDEEREIVAKVARGEPIDHYETIRIAKDGRPVPVSLTVSPLYDAAGKVVGASKNARDMTARKQAADALRDADEAAQLTHIDNKSLMVSERFIKKVMDATPGLMAYWTSDLRCKLANKPYFEWFGRTADGIIGISVLELFGEKLFAINEPHIRGVLAGEKQQFEREMTSADGKLRQALVNFIPDVVGDEVLGYFAQSTDVTAMKATEAALRDEIAGRERANQLLWESEMALQQAQRLGQFGSWEWQVEEDIMSWSDELYRIFDRGPKSTPSGLAEHSKFYVPESWTRLKTAIESALKTGESYSIELQFVRPCGQHGWIETRGESVRDQLGNVIRLRGTSQNISERIAREQAMAAAHASLEKLARHLDKARAAAVRASEAKTRFLAGISHELRTPLNGILGYAHLLRLEAGLTPVQAERVDAMLGAGEHLLQMINRVLDFSEVEVGHAELRLSEIDPRQIARMCVDMVRPSADAKGLALEFVEAPRAPLRVTTDLTRLRQVLVNLLGNAVKFTALGGVTLRLGPCADGAGLRFEVVDTGRGISAEHRGRLFQEFERLDADTKIDGAGLGLAISARLAETMGGSLGYENDPNGGSLFWLDLPLALGPAYGLLDAATFPNLPGAAPAPARSLRILVVDDQAMNRDIAGSFLRAAGHEAFFAENGMEAVTAAGASDYDVVLMDVRMPVMDGLEATRRIRTLAGRRSRVPIVGVTAQAFTEQIAECLRAGMNAHLSKPLTPERLLSSVVRAVDAPKLRGEISSAPEVNSDGVETIDPPAIDSDPPVMDMVAFDRTTAFLAPGAVASYLRTIIERGEALLADLRAARVFFEAGLVAKAHTLSGNASMFGLERLAEASGRFERAAQTAAPEVSSLAFCLQAAIEASVFELKNRIRAIEAAASQKCPVEAQALA